MKIRIGSIRRWLKSKILSVILVLILLTVIYYDSLVYFAYRAFHVVSYSTRPFWDKQIDNFTDFTFYGSSQSEFLPKHSGIKSEKQSNLARQEQSVLLLCASPKGKSKFFKILWIQQAIFFLFIVLSAKKSNSWD